MVSRTARTRRSTGMPMTAFHSPPPPTHSAARPPQNSFSVSSAFAIFSGCISQGLTTITPIPIRSDAIASGTALMKASRAWA